MADTIQTVRSDNRLTRVTAADPEYTLSIIGLTLVASGNPIVGLVLSVLALKESKRDGRYNVFALLGMILGIIFSVLTVLAFIAYGALIFGGGLLNAFRMQ